MGQLEEFPFIFSYKNERADTVSAQITLCHCERFFLAPPARADVRSNPQRDEEIAYPGEIHFVLATVC